MTSSVEKCLLGWDCHWLSVTWSCVVLEWVCPWWEGWQKREADINCLQNGVHWGEFINWTGLSLVLVTTCFHGYRPMSFFQCFEPFLYSLVNTVRRNIKVYPHLHYRWSLSLKMRFHLGRSGFVCISNSMTLSYLNLRISCLNPLWGPWQCCGTHDPGPQMSNNSKTNKIIKRIYSKIIKCTKILRAMIQVFPVMKNDINPTSSRVHLL